MNGLHHNIEEEIRMAEEAEISGDHRLAFSHLERARSLGGSLNEGDTRLPWVMLKLAVKMRSYREICGQFIRLVEAAAKAQFAGFAAGETVQLDISSFKPVPVLDHPQAIPPTGKAATRQPSAPAAIKDKFEQVPSVAEIEKLAMSLGVAERRELASRLLQSLPQTKVHEINPADKMQHRHEPDSLLRPGITLEELERRIAEGFRV